MKRSVLLCGLGAVFIGSRQSVGAKDNKPNRLRKERRKLFGEKEREANERFYDLDSLSDAEKLDVIKKAYYLSQVEVDWRERYDLLMRTVHATKHEQNLIEHSFGNDDAYNGNIDDTLDSNTEASHMDPVLISNRRRLQKNNYDKDVFGGYEYDKGNCPNAGSLGVPCAPNNIARLCNKYDRNNGSLKACIDACSPAFCCIHDAPRQANFLAPNCNTDENCAQYNYCYIAWWKLHDTVGPGLFLRVEQDDEFFDIPAEEIEGNAEDDPFLTQVLLHHFDDIAQIIEDGTVGNEFNADRIFLDPDYWTYPVTGEVDIDDGFE